MEIQKIKSCLKRKVKITEGLLVVFMITGRIISASVNEDTIIKDIILSNNMMFMNNGSLNNKFTNSGNINIIVRGISDNATFSNNGIFSMEENAIVENNGYISVKNENIKDSRLSYSSNGIALTSDYNVINNGAIDITTDLVNSSSRYFGNGFASINNDSEFGLITNNSLINSSISVENTSLDSSGNGTIISASNISNNGLIKGSIKANNSNVYFSGNGYSFQGMVRNIGKEFKAENNGIISGESDGVVNNSGNGLVSSSGDRAPNYYKTALLLNNNGLIKGNSINDNSISSNGNGIIIVDADKLILNNSGLILGSNSAIAHYKEILMGSVNNYGLLIGKNIYRNFEDDQELNFQQENNQGMYIKLDENLNVKEIVQGTGGIVENKEIINIGNNGKNDGYIELDRKTEYSNKIINGVGVENGVLTVNNTTLTLKDSTINAYKKALELKGGSILELTNSIVNGGGLDSKTPVIAGDIGNNKANINNSIINGDINLGGGDDELNLSTNILNGNLNGDFGNDILSLNNMNIFSNIQNFENINIDGKTTLYETSSISNGNINVNNNLNLRLDISNKDGNGYIKGHALYNHTGDVTFNNNGKLTLILNGLGKNSIVAMNGTNIINPNNPNDLWWKDNRVDTNSLVLDAKIMDDGNIYVGVKELIDLLPIPPVSPESPVKPEISLEIDNILYEKLNKIYKSIVSSKEIGKLANTTLLEGKTYNESLGELLTILDQMYANNPYAYTLKSSKDSMKLFEDNLSYLTIKPKKSELIVQGKGVYSGVKTDNESNGKNYYGFDTEHRNYKTTTSIAGGLSTCEYGLNDKTSLGIVLGGNNQSVNYKGSSKIKGNSLYLGTFIKIEINKLNLNTGIGYQYTRADIDRNISNKYDSFNNNAKYDINSLSAFIEAKYSIELKDSLSINPKGKLSFYYITQDDLSEKYAVDSISMKVDEVNNNTLDVELGVDIIKSYYLNSGKLNSILSLSGIQMIGDESKELNGYILGDNTTGSKFDIQGAKLSKTLGKVSYNIEFEKNNGFIYTVGADYTFSRSNKNIGITTGIGYKF